MSWGESNWIVNKIKSAWTDTRAGYIDLLANGTYGLNALKNAINLNRDYVYQYGNTTTLGTGSAVSKVGRSQFFNSLAYNVLKDGVYRIDMNYSIENLKNGDTLYSNSSNINIGQISVRSAVYTLDELKSSGVTQNIDAIVTNGAATKSLTMYVFLHRGMRVNIGAITSAFTSPNSEKATHKINSCTIKAVKTNV